MSDHPTRSLYCDGTISDVMMSFEMALIDTAPLQVPAFHPCRKPPIGSVKHNPEVFSENLLEHGLGFKDPGMGGDPGVPSMSIF